MYLYLGKNGPGAGIAINGEIVRGKTFFSGEVQFVPQYDNRNFIEALSSGNGASTIQIDHRVDAISRLVATITSILKCLIKFFFLLLFMAVFVKFVVF